ncbi:MAG: hypothetical protein Q4P72_06400, partial [Eubacteriales bacterium]|nr:hypothetical protein [Eubacteriales bacterium]
KLYAGRTRVNIDYNRFDYVFVYLRLLEEMNRRCFDLPEANVGDPEWENERRIWCNIFAREVYGRFRDYYEQRPQELEYLKSLAPQAFEQETAC